MRRRINAITDYNNPRAMTAQRRIHWAVHMGDIACRFTQQSERGALVEDDPTETLLWFVFAEV